MNFPVVGAGSQFFSFREARSDAYRVSANDERQRNGENWPQPSGFHPIAQRPRAGDPGLRRKSPHTLLSSSTVDPPQPSDSASYGTICPRNADRAKVHNRLLSLPGIPRSRTGTCLVWRGPERFVGSRELYGSETACTE